MPTATHAIGDAAVRHVLDSVVNAKAERRPQGPGAARAVRHRVEHVETVPDDTVRRFAPLGVAASMQPAHCCEFTRADHTDNWSRRLGEERAGRAFRCRDLWEAGARIVLGSDWPIAPYPPLEAMAGARHRRPADLSPPPHGPAQALTPLQALQGMTVNAAWAAGRRHGQGRSPWGTAPTSRSWPTIRAAVADTDLADLPVVLTVVGGRVTYRGTDV
ncbi:amidohydrolase family protein [Streptomyces lasalocidi]